MLDCEDWEVVLRVYAGHPNLALILAQHLDHLKRALESGPEGITEVVTGLSLGVDSLYKHTMFHVAGRKLFSLALTGELLPEHEEMIQALSNESNQAKGKSDE